VNSRPEAAQFEALLASKACMKVGSAGITSHPRVGKETVAM